MAHIPKAATSAPAATNRDPVASYDIADRGFIASLPGSVVGGGGLVIIDGMSSVESARDTFDRNSNMVAP
jgi:hypothetical protein